MVDGRSAAAHSLPVGFPAAYESVLADPPPSVLLAVLPPGASEVGVTEARARLAASGLPITYQCLATEREVPGARWELTIELEGERGPSEVRAWLEPTPREALDAPTARNLDSQLVARAQTSEWAIGVRAHLGDQPLFRFHEQLAVLAVLVPDALVVLDANAYTPRPGDWLREAAGCVVPPRPEALFVVHCVHDEQSEQAWLHTHGLDRCGSIELDALDVPIPDAPLVHQLVNCVATMMIEQGPPDPGVAFLAGRDLELCWLPWEEGLKKHGKGCLGGKHDRDEPHGGARGLLFVPTKGFWGRKLASPACYAPVLADNPMLYVSTMETERRSLLANERLERFRRLVELGRPCGQRVMFLVKLGYPMDGNDDEEQREHLWFEVHAMSDETVDATLLNEPYHVASLKEGQRDLHALDKLSDWSVLYEAGQFGPESISELERLFDDESVQA